MLLFRSQSTPLGTYYAAEERIFTREEVEEAIARVQKEIADAKAAEEARLAEKKEAEENAKKLRRTSRRASRSRMVTRRASTGPLRNVKLTG